MNPFAGAHTVLFVHAHPDDETLSSGGLILWLVERGVRVHLLTATRGERGEVVPALRDRAGGDRAALTGIRIDELARAARALGITDARYLGEPPARAEDLPPRRYLDSGMRWITPTVAGPVDDAPVDALTRAPEAEVAADVLAYVQHVAPDLVISYDDQGGYGHPDHRFIRAAALAASRTAGVPFVELVEPDAAGAFVVDSSDRLGAVKDALRAHATQLTVDGGDVVHSGGQREPIRTAVGVRLVP
ncbi:PIG-L family deacetylase [Humibacter ginsenosidimutans]|uniref:PIG-L family deacetylase n=1 Tax=Humibacter ginsenosidimutans TaxID=2599293 RepID=UPI00143DBA48|nr:PIG-L family deacetylase [Humibacter ginsenosidimutans]